MQPSTPSDEPAAEAAVGGGSAVGLSQFVAPFVRRRLLEGGAAKPEPGIEHFEATLLMADVSGFTELSERLAQEGVQGSERLRETLGRVFGPLTGAIDDNGGQVFKIAGDAVLAIWPAPADDPLAAAITALAAGAILAPGGAAADLGLQMRVVIGRGTAWVATVGGVQGRWETLVGGAVLEQAATALRLAAPGDVVLSGPARLGLGERAVGVALEEGCWRLDSLSESARPSARQVVSVVMTEPALEVLEAFVPRIVRSRLDAGQADWLAEFRRVSVLFANFEGLDEASAGFIERLQRAVVSLQEAVYGFDGSVIQVLVDEKGTGVVAAWGLSQRVHEDDAERAVRAALEIEAELGRQGLGSKIGIATGRIFNGTRGGDDYRDFAVIGNIVNLAARLMTNAGGRILCDDETRRSAALRVEFEELSGLRFKGRRASTATFSPVRLRPLQLPRAESLVDRSEERALLDDVFGRLEAGESSIVLLEGEAGIGKSCLAADVLRRCDERSFASVVSNCDALESATPYHAWRGAFDGLLEIDRHDGVDRRRAAVVGCLEPWPELQDRAALLNPIVGSDFAADGVVDGMSPEARAGATREILVRIFRRATAGRPTVLVLEDIHWMDSASWGLAGALLRIEDPILFLMASRPLDAAVPEEARPLLEHAGLRRIELGELPADDALAMVCQRLGVDALPRPIARLILEKAAGQPLFSEQLAYACRDQGVLRIENGTCRLSEEGAAERLTFPGTLEGVVSSRVDGLRPEVQLTLKVASVLGTSFSVAALESLHPLSTPAASLREEIAELVDAALIERSTAEEGGDRFAFRHAVTRDVAYDLLPYAQRRPLHQAAAQWFEGGADDSGAASPATLALHWGEAGRKDRALMYLERAGEEAIRDLANREAIGFFERALAIRAESPALADDLRVAGWRLQLCRACMQSGLAEQARRHGEDCLSGLGLRVAGTQVVVALTLMAEVVRQGGHLLGLRGWRSKARRTTEGRRRTSIAIDAFSQLARIGFFLNQPVLMLHYAVRGLNLCDGWGSEDQKTDLFTVAGNICGMVPLRRLVNRYYRSARLAAESCRSPLTVSSMHQSIGHYLAGVGDFDAAMRELTRAQELSARFGERRQWEEQLTNFGNIWGAQGEFRRFEEVSRRLQSLANERDDPEVVAWGISAEIFCRMRLGDLEGVLDGVERWHANGPEALGEPIVLATWSNALLLLGRVDEAFDVVQRAIVLARERPILSFSQTSLPVRILETLLGLRESDALDSAGRRLVDAQLKRGVRQVRSVAGRFPMVLSEALICEGRSLWQAGRSARAEKVLRRAVDEARSGGRPYVEAVARYWLGRVLVDGAEAGRMFEAASSGFADVGAALDEAMALGALKELEK